MEERKKHSETLRIDLMPGVGAAPVSPLTRVDWSSTGKVPEYVAQSRYRELLEGLYDAVLVTRVSGRVLDVNARAVAFFHYEDWELSRLSLGDLVAGVNQDLLDSLVSNLDRERFSLIQAFCIRKDGTYFPAEISVSRLRLDGPCLCFLIRDITLRMEAEERLRLEHEALLLVAEGVVITDCDGVIQFANPQAGCLLGQEVESLIGKGLSEQMEAGEQAAGLSVALQQSQEALVFDCALKREGGAPLPVTIRAVCKRAEDGEAMGLVLALRERVGAEAI